jgi:hypothetical protein
MNEAHQLIKKCHELRKASRDMQAIHEKTKNTPEIMFELGRQSAFLEIISEYAEIVEKQRKQR